MSHDLKLGAEPVKGYFLIERLGKGGFGEVWKATGPGGFEVALKFVALEGSAGPVELRALQVIKDIRHPHLLGTFGSWQDDGQLIIAMELAERTLMDRFRESVGQGFPGIPAPEIFEHFLDAAQALDYLNEPRHPTGGSGPQGIQHRDVKPQNLLIVGGSVKVADFGLARVLEHSTTGHTGSLTPSYAAPEFFEQKTSSHSDQYSLAVTYCHLRGGRLPFEGNPAAVIYGHMHREPDLSMIPEAERPAVARALAKSPRERWPSCRTFVQAVMTAEGVEVPLTRTPVDASWRKTTHPDTAALGQPSKPDPLSELTIAPPRSRKRSFYKLGVWALVAAVLLLAILLLFPRGKPADAVASRTPGTEKPEIKGEGTAKRPGNEVTEPAPTVATKTPWGEVTKPEPSPAPAVAKPEKDAKAIRDHIERGLSFYMAEDPEKALAEFNEAIRLDPGNAEAHAGRAFTYYRGMRQDNRQGLREAEEALRLDPRSALAHTAHGYFLLADASSKNHSAAIAECEEAIRLDPNLVWAYFIRGRIYNARYVALKQIKDNEQSIVEFTNAIRLDQNLAPAYADRGTSLRNGGHLDRAMADFDKALLLNPRSKNALMQRARAWQKKGDHSRAIADCDRAIEIDPRYSIAYIERAISFAAMGDKARAKNDRDQAARLKREEEP